MLSKEFVFKLTGYMSLIFVVIGALTHTLGIMILISIVATGLFRYAFAGEKTWPQKK